MTLLAALPNLRTNNLKGLGATLTLYQPGCVDLAVKLIEELAANKTTAQQRGSKPRFFISYARSRPAEADYIEMTLRRRRFEVYRDERDFGAGRDLPHEVAAYIERSNVFIVVWCQEYACSPWCFDELEIALKRKEGQKSQLWILCVDETRIVHPKARKILNSPSYNRDQLERSLLTLLEQWERQLAG